MEKKYIEFHLKKKPVKGDTAIVFAPVVILMITCVSPSVTLRQSSVITVTVGCHSSDRAVGDVTLHRH